MTGGRRGGGRGRGYRHIFNATGLPRWMRGGRLYGEQAEAAYAADDIGSLRQEADLLEKRLESIIERIRALDTGSGKENG